MNQNSNTKWDIIIRPKSGWLDLHLSDIWGYRDLTMLFVWKDFVVQHKQSILGPLWYVSQPVFSTFVFTIIFGKIVNISTDGLPQFLFYMAGITCWNFFSECYARTSSTFIANADLFGKAYFPRLAVPVSLVISSIMKFGIQFLFFIGFLAYSMMSGENVRPNSWIFLMPYLLLLIAGLGLGAGIIISALTTKYRDLQYLVGLGTQLLMYASPVIYPLSIIPEKYRWIALANPLTPILEAFRYAFLGSGSFSVAHLLYSTLVTVIILFLGILLFNRIEKTFMDTV
jgi:lipopolysaccharide transport system permease protein